MARLSCASIEAMKTLLAGLFALLCLVANGADWKLIWSDEFDKPGLPDPAKWTNEVGFVRNNEAQYYTQRRAENARVEGGMLVIEGRKESFNNEGRRGPRTAEYTSASLTTEGKASWTYGRIEVRAKLPSARGTWPAIWMLGTSHRQVGWPACGEIDIMEFVGHEPGVVHANVHMTKYNHARGTGKGSRTKVPTISEAFHVYALEWYPDRLEFYVDEKKYFTFNKEPGGNDVWPFDKPHYLLLNLAIGGAWGGAQGIDAGAFPQKYFIDYVRVYERVAR
jgi:beta-glucanase (GH16 family)